MLEGLGAEMVVQQVQTLAGVDDLRESWMQTYAADDQATIFTSWPWMRGWLKVCPHRWSVLICRQRADSPPLAFLPICFRRGPGLVPQRELHLAGSSMADYTGMVLSPGHELQALSSFAQYMERHLRWDVLHFRNLMDKRVERLVGILTNSSQSTPTDSTPCPLVHLPGSWEQYCREKLATSKRQDLARCMRKIESDCRYRLVETERGNFESSFTALMRLWQGRWGDRTEKTINQFKSIYLQCLDAGCLRLAVLQDGDKPIAAISEFVDVVRSTTSFHIGGFDPEYSRLSPGRVLLGMSIRRAIEQGFGVYDFLRGAEEYKYGLGAVDRHCLHLRMERHNFRYGIARAYHAVEALLSR